MFRKSFSTIFLMFMLFLQAQIKSPKEYLGYTLGTNFSRHHQVVDYFKHLEAGSESLQLQPYGKTNEGRLLQLVFISSPKNLKNLETIRKTHLQNSGVEKGALNNEKVIVWLSYNGLRKFYFFILLTKCLNQNVSMGSRITFTFSGNLSFKIAQGWKYTIKRF